MESQRDSNLLPDSVLESIHASYGGSLASRRQVFDATRLRWVVDEAIQGVSFAYQAGELPKSTSDTVSKYLDGDLGVLNSLNLVRELLLLAFQHKNVPNNAIFEAISTAFDLDFTPLAPHLGGN